MSNISEPKNNQQQGQFKISQDRVKRKNEKTNQIKTFAPKYLSKQAQSDSPSIFESKPNLKASYIDTNSQTDLFKTKSDAFAQTIAPENTFPADIFYTASALPKPKQSIANMF